MPAISNFPKHEPNRRTILWLRNGRVCYWCGIPTRLVNGNAWDAATRDHIVPRHRGGTNEDSNLVSACRLCNNRRSYEDTKGLPEGSMLGLFLPRREHGGRIWIIDERRLRPMSDDSLDEVSKKLADAIRPVTEFRIHKLERRIVEPMDKDRKKTTKELQDESKKLLEEGAVLQKESEKTLERLTMMIEGERISFTRTSPTRTRDMTIYFDKLTDEQKQKLERIDQALFDMAEKVTERGTRTLKDDGAVKE